MRIPHNVVHIGVLPRRMPHIAPPRNHPRTGIRRRTRSHFAIRRHMPPDLGKQPLDTEMRSQPLPLVVNDFHGRCIRQKAYGIRSEENSKSICGAADLVSADRNRPPAVDEHKRKRACRPATLTSSTAQLTNRTDALADDGFTSGRQRNARKMPRNEIRPVRAPHPTDQFAGDQMPHSHR